MVRYSSNKEQIACIISDNLFIKQGSMIDRKTLDSEVRRLVEEFGFDDVTPEIVLRHLKDEHYVKIFEGKIYTL